MTTKLEQLVALYDIRPGNGAGPYSILTTPEPARGPFQSITRTGTDNVTRTTKRENIKKLQK